MVVIGKILMAALARGDIPAEQRKDFYLFINEYDKRRGKDFLKTFPEMKEFYNSCRKLALV